MKVSSLSFVVGIVAACVPCGDQRAQEKKSKEDVVAAELAKKFYASLQDPDRMRKLLDVPFSWAKREVIQKRDELDKKLTAEMLPKWTEHKMTQFEIVKITTFDDFDAKERVRLFKGTQRVLGKNHRLVVVRCKVKDQDHGLLLGVNFDKEGNGLIVGVW